MTTHELALYLLTGDLVVSRKPPELRLLPILCVCAGFGLAPSAHAQELLVVNHGGRMVPILVALPEDHDSTRACPLLVILHGNGGTALSLLSNFRRYPFRDVILAAPEGEYPRDVGGATGYSWYLETTDRSLWEEADRRTVDGILATIARVASVHRVDGVVIFGFSQGASVAYMTGLLHPSMIRGIGAVGGALPEIDRQGSLLSMEHVARAKQVRIFVARGEDDASVPSDRFDRQVEFFREQGYDVTAHSYAGGHRLTLDLLRTFSAWLKE